MPLEISRNDILKIRADAIIDPTDEFLSGSGSIDQLIHEKAGEGLKKALEGLSLEEGKALITESFDLDNCKYIIHTCGPVYEDGNHDEDEILASCYRECLRLAKGYRLESVAFPLIASGSFMFPKGRALRIATDTITEFLLNNEMNVYLLVYDKESFDTASRLYKDIQNYLDKDLFLSIYESRIDNSSALYNKDISLEECMEIAPTGSAKAAASEEPVFEPDESFSQCLIRLINKMELTDPEVYHRSNITRQTFNKLVNDKSPSPKKETVAALAIGMGLNMKDTRILLERAGYVLSDSFVFDKIIRYCIQHKIYNIFKVNEILFFNDQKTLGC